MYIYIRVLLAKALRKTSNGFIKSFESKIICVVGLIISNTIQVKSKHIIMKHNKSTPVNSTKRYAKIFSGIRQGVEFSAFNLERQCSVPRGNGRIKRNNVQFILVRVC